MKGTAVDPKARVEQTRADFGQMALYLLTAYKQAGMTSEQAAEQFVNDLQKLADEHGPKYVDPTKISGSFLNPKIMLNRIVELMKKDRDRTVQAYLRHLLDFKTAMGW